MFDEPVPGLPSAGSMGSGGSVPTPRAGHNLLQRRLTLGDFNNIAENRPLSGHGRCEYRYIVPIWNISVIMFGLQKGIQARSCIEQLLDSSEGFFNLKRILDNSTFLSE